MNEIIAFLNEIKTKDIMNCSHEDIKQLLQKSDHIRQILNKELADLNIKQELVKKDIENLNIDVSLQNKTEDELVQMSKDLSDDINLNLKEIEQLIQTANLG